MEKHCDVTLMYKNEKRNKTLSLCAKTTRDKKNPRILRTQYSAKDSKTAPQVSA